MNIQKKISAIIEERRKVRIEGLMHSICKEIYTNSNYLVTNREHIEIELSRVRPEIHYIGHIEIINFYIH